MALPDIHYAGRSVGKAAEMLRQEMRSTAVQGLSDAGGGMGAREHRDMIRSFIIAAGFFPTALLIAL